MVRRNLPLTREVYLRVAFDRDEAELGAEELATVPAMFAKNPGSEETGVKDPGMPRSVETEPLPERQESKPAPPKPKPKRKTITPIRDETGKVVRYEVEES